MKSVKGKALRGNLLALIILMCLFFPHPAYAEVNIGKHFGFGDIKSLGDTTSQLMPPIFSIATFLVIIYFLTGAFKYLKAGGNKEEVEGGKQMIVHAIIGFLLLTLAFLVIQFALSSLFGITNFQIF